MSDETDAVVQHAAREAKACDACLDAVLAVAREAYRAKAFEEAARVADCVPEPYEAIRELNVPLTTPRLLVQATIRATRGQIAATIRRLK